MRLDQIKRRLEIIYSAELTESAKILRKQQEFDKFTEIFKKNDDFGEDGDLKKFSDFNNAFFLGLYSYYQGFDRYVNYFNSGETLSSVLEELKSAQDSSEYDNLANFIEARSALKSKQDLCAGDNHTSNLSK